MAKNKDFYHRIAIIDECLRRRDKRWYVEELLNCVNDRLCADYGKTISQRTLYGDIKYLREEKYAPIEKVRDANKVQIRYSDVNFSIKNIPLQDDELNLLKDGVSILKEISGLAIVEDIDIIVKKLENSISSGQQFNDSIIQFEKHTLSRGSTYIDDIFTAIKVRITLDIDYQPFGKDEPYRWLVYPYLLKEYRNRWFLIGGLKGEQKIINVALDRIQKLRPSPEPFLQNEFFDKEKFFRDLIGVSLPEGETVSDIIINVNSKQAPYVQTKPIHFSQETLQTNKDGSIQIKLRLINNYELRSVLLSYGADIEVLQPVRLRTQLKDAFRSGYEVYQ